MSKDKKVRVCLVNGGSTAGVLRIFNFNTIAGLYRNVEVESYKDPDGSYDLVFIEECDRLKFGSETRARATLQKISDLTGLPKYLLSSGCADCRLTDEEKQNFGVRETIDDRRDTTTRIRTIFEAYGAIRK